jgi:hypothetical protein
MSRNPECSWCGAVASLTNGLCRACDRDARQDRDFFIDKDEADD